jgi:hypothetical protein
VAKNNDLEPKQTPYPHQGVPYHCASSTELKISAFLEEQADKSFLPLVMLLLSIRCRRQPSLDNSHKSNCTFLFSLLRSDLEGRLPLSTRLITD